MRKQIATTLLTKVLLTDGSPIVFDFICYASRTYVCKISWYSAK